MPDWRFPAAKCVARGAQPQPFKNTLINQKEINQMNQQNNHEQQDSLNDLPVAQEQAEETKAGTGAHGSGAGGGMVAMQDFHFVMR
jgi:hypothetical protein